eukprot:scaffold70663_cov19-Prasinocladus_malaysianus.AAC.4
MNHIAQWTPLSRVPNNVAQRTRLKNVECSRTDTAASTINHHESSPCLVTTVETALNTCQYGDLHKAQIETCHFALIEVVT